MRSASASPGRAVRKEKAGNDRVRVRTQRREEQRRAQQEEQRRAQLGRAPTMAATGMKIDGREWRMTAAGGGHHDPPSLQNCMPMIMCMYDFVLKFV